MDFAELEVPLQEFVLDELDRIAGAAGPLPGKTFVHDFVHEAAGVRHYVFLRLAVDERKELLVIFGVSHFSRPVG